MSEACEHARPGDYVMLCHACVADLRDQLAASLHETDLRDQKLEELADKLDASQRELEVANADLRGYRDGMARTLVEWHEYKTQLTASRAEVEGLRRAMEEYSLTIQREWAGLQKKHEARVAALEGALREVSECPLHSLMSCMCQRTARALLPPKD